MKKITLIGTGCGHLSTITAGAVAALKDAALIIGAPRLLESLPSQWGRDRWPAIAAEEIRDIIRDYPEEEGKICVVYSGDAGFYSGARTLLPLMEEEGWEAEVLPGISSVQMMAAKMKMPWQDWKLVSAHGLEVQADRELEGRRPVFFLTGGKLGPADICRQLTDAGLGDTPVAVGERLSYEDEQIRRGKAEELAGEVFDSLSVILVMPEASEEKRPVFRPGIPDRGFIRGEVPMTKQDVRAVIAGRMQTGEEDIVWDVGAGTGSVSVELALQTPKGKVWAVERDPEGCLLIRQNRERFGLANLEVVEGAAPEALADLPAPDKVFIGGSGGHMEEIISIAAEKNPHVRICASAILLETVTEALTAMAAHGMDTDAVQVSVSTARQAGGKHMMMGANPIFIITGERPCSGS